MYKGTAFIALFAVLTSQGCGSMPKQQPIPTVPQVELARFMGAWYVIGVIPTYLERGAYNAVEKYEMNPDGTIATTFTFRKNGFNGELKEYHPKGFIREDPSNAVWGMQFVWPIKAEYLIAHLDDAYTTTVIARNKRDYAWIMSRTPTMPANEYEQLVKQLGAWGYDIQTIQRVPQRW